VFGPAGPSPFPLSHLDRSFDAVGPRPRLDSMSSVEEDDYDTLTDIDSDKNVIRTKVRHIALPCPALPRRIWSKGLCAAPVANHCAVFGRQREKN
jgi:hypothetical protein